jgi:hypothetical protein
MWAGTRGDNLLVGPGTPLGSKRRHQDCSISIDYMLVVVEDECGMSANQSFDNPGVLVKIA